MALSFPTPITITKQIMVDQTSNVSTGDFTYFSYNAKTKRAEMLLVLSGEQKMIVVEGADFDALVSQNTSVIQSVRSVMMQEGIKQGILPTGTTDTWPN